MQIRTLQRRVFWPDTHFPLHDARAVAVARTIVRSVRPHELIFLGDLQDCAAVSEHSKTPEVEWRGLKDELSVGIELMHEIVKDSRAKHVTYLFGNHEKRISKYINKYSQKLHGLLDPVDVLGIPKGWTWVPYGGPRAFYRCGNSNLIAIHGSLLGKHPASRNVEKYKVDVICGHTHKIQVFKSTDVLGRVSTGISAGHLANTEELAEYVDSVADWQQGLVVGYFKRSGTYWVEPYEIINGETVQNGKLITGR